MKRIKIVLSTLLVFLLLASGMVFNACVKDPCDKIVCKNSGVCRDGRCKCATGFEGENCQWKMYEKFIGTWDCSLRINGGVATPVNLVVSPGATPNKMNIYNIFAQNISIEGVIDGDKFTVATQSVNNIDYTGNGYVEGKYLTIYLEQDDHNNSTHQVFEYNGTKYTNP